MTPTLVLHIFSLSEKEENAFIRLVELHYVLAHYVYGVYI